RVRRGNRQLAALGRPVSARPLALAELLALVRARTVSLPDFGCYVAVMALDRIAAHLPAARGWGSDRTSRAAS
ncbi:hypothetical protein, partial [Actinocorallia lasiicapitis]